AHRPLLPRLARDGRRPRGGDRAHQRDLPRRLARRRPPRPSLPLRAGLVPPGPRAPRRHPRRARRPRARPLPRAEVKRATIALPGGGIDGRARDPRLDGPHLRAGEELGALGAERRARRAQLHHARAARGGGAARARRHRGELRARPGRRARGRQPGAGAAHDGRRRRRAREPGPRRPPDVARLLRRRLPPPRRHAPRRRVSRLRAGADVQRLRGRRREEHRRAAQRDLARNRRRDRRARRAARRRAGARRRVARARRPRLARGPRAGRARAGGPRRRGRPALPLDRSPDAAREGRALGRDPGGHGGPAPDLRALAARTPHRAARHRRLLRPDRRRPRRGLAGADPPVLPRRDGRPPDRQPRPARALARLRRAAALGVLPRRAAAAPRARHRLPGQPDRDLLMPELPAEVKAIAARVRNWGRWGPEDELGTLNLVDAAAVRRGAAEVRSGKRIALGLPLDEKGPQTGVVPGRINPLRTMLMINHPYLKGDRRNFCNSDDSVTMGLQSGTHWDALAHVSYEGRIWNGYPADVVDYRGARRCGIEKVKSLVSRGVLLDVARVRGVERLPGGTALTPSDLDAAAELTRIRLEPGDVVFVRTGHVQLLRAGDRTGYIAP